MVPCVHVLLCITFCPYCNHLDGEERAGRFTLFVFLVYCDCYGCGCSLRCCWCDCDISWSCSHAFYSCVALRQQAVTLFLFNLCFFLKLSKIPPCNSWYYDIILTFYTINRPGADFCMSLSIWTGTTYLPDKGWLQELNPEVFCVIGRHFVLSKCSSKCSVGRNLYMYTMSHNGNKIMRENMHDVHLLLFF